MKTKSVTSGGSIPTTGFTNNCSVTTESMEKMFGRYVAEPLIKNEFYYPHYPHVCAPGAGCGPDNIIEGCSNHAGKSHRGVDFLWLELTAKCNLKCIHCYGNSGPHLLLQTEIQYEEWRKILKDAFKEGCKKVQFIGGEPTLHPNLSQLIADARNIGFEVIEIFTNGTLIDKRLLETFKDFGVNLAFSIYGSEAAIHDVITQQKGSFMKTINSLRNAINSGIPVRVCLVAMQHNAECIDATVLFIKNLGVRSVTVDWVRGQGRGEMLLQNKPPLNAYCSACIQNKLYIDSTGNVFPCVFARSFQIGYISEGLHEIVKSESLQNIRHTIAEKMGTSFPLSTLQ